ncbi:MAG TPA: LLM class flavin-dependent oxidoreductase [Candidatus Binatia bacterium]|nr:LLM class flavin-dependent oxidoreductase [Candidatus Binatia bacterium]
MGLEFGLFYEIPVAAPWHERSEYDAYHHVIKQAVRGDELGFSHFWTVEHHFLSEFSHCSSPEVLYGAVAAKTKRIKIGHGVRLLPFPYNHPIRVAEMAGALDIICDGRLEFGTGRSATRQELEGFGIDPDHTRSMWEEALRLVVGAWTTDEFSFDGKHFKVPPRRVHPKPIQKPHPPLWMASTSPESHELCGHNGLGLLSFTIGVPPEELAGRIELYRKGLAHAQPVGRFVNSRAATFTMVHCADTDDEARQNAAESVVWYLRRSVQLIGELATWQEEKQREFGTYQYSKMLRDLDTSFLDYDTLDAMGAVIVGTPERCIERVKRYRDAGCDQLLCLMQPYNIPPDKVMRSIELFGQHVIPAFR